MSPLTLETPTSVPAFRIAPFSCSYDTIPYPSRPFEDSHPDHLYTMARLFQLNPQLPDEARILELGCGSGGNLIPVAEQLPRASFVGLDLSTKQITEGLGFVDAMKLTNVRLLAQDFSHIDPSLGNFDYIICHGVFSWVPPEVQRRILEICRDRLNPNGVAYISYNANPGWFMRGMIRQMMLHHVDNVADPIIKVQQARALLSFLVDSTEGHDTAYANFLRHESDLLAKQSDAYLFHEHLEDNNHPLFFYEFVELAAANGLQFMSECNLASMITSNLPDKVAQTLTRLTNDLHDRSQYTDFVTNRLFRQSLLCHKGAQVVRKIDDGCIPGMFFSAQLRAEKLALGQDLSPTASVSFNCEGGRIITTSNPILKALMYTLADAWPASLTLPQLCQVIEQRLSGIDQATNTDHQSVVDECESHLLHMLVRGDLKFRYVHDRFVREISQRPAVSHYARLQSRDGNDITTLRHVTVVADSLSRIIINALDGARTKEDLVSLLSEMLAEGKITANSQGRSIEDLTSVFRISVDRNLETLRRAALLAK